MTRAALLLIAAALHCAGCGAIRFGELDPPPGRLMVVGVSLEGNSALSTGDVEDQIATYSENFSITGDKPLLDRAALPADARRIESIYAANGYFDARVVEYRVVPRDDKTVRVQFHVQEGDPTRVAEVLTEGIDDAEVAGDEEQAKLLREVRDQLPDLIGLEVGEIWTEDAWRLAKARVQRALVDRGFVYAEVIGAVNVDRDERTAGLVLQVSHGPLTRVKDVVVRGSVQIPPERIMRRVGLETGQVVIPSALRDTEVDIYDLGAFYSVTATPVRKSAAERLDGAQPTLQNLEAIEWDPDVSVEVVVQEMPIHEVRAGIGAGIDNKRSEAYVSGGYQNRNLFGDLRFLDLSVAPSLIVLPGFFEPTKLAPGLDTGAVFKQPSLLTEHLLFTLTGRYELEAELSYQTHKVTATPMLSHRFFGFLTLFVAYSVEFHNFFGFEDAKPSLSLEDTLGLAFRETYLISMLQQGVVVDLRDNVYDPRNGVFASIAVEEALTAIGSDFHFYRLLGDVRAFVQAADWLVFGARIKGGHVFNDFGGEVPLSARFKGGGPSDMRGFGSLRMGPVVCQSDGKVTTVTTDDIGCPAGSGDPLYVGGSTMIEGSVEARVYLPWNFGLVAFVDVGEVWAQAQDVDLELLNIAVGPGLRYYTPFGPIRADLGFLLTTPNPPELVFHLSIGQAF